MVRMSVLVAIVSALWFVTPASAQPLGTFRWQMQPYCNIITVAVVQQGGHYQLDGFDDQCGAAQRAGLVGLAFQNPNGSIGFGLTVVTAPGARPVHVDATIAIATLNGTWRDSAGNTGSFVLTPGAGTGGAPRPIPSGGLAPGSVTGVQIAAGAVGVAQVNTAEVQARVAAACSGGAIAAIAANGTVLCTPSDAGPSKRDLFDLTPVPASATSFSTAVVFASANFIAPITGRAMAMATGYCESTSLTTGATSTILSMGEATDEYSRFYLAPRRLPQEATAQLHQWPWAIQRDITIVAGTSYTLVVKGYHGEGPTAAASCAGNISIRVHTGVYP
jgi:hypothetical protein